MHETMPANAAVQSEQPFDAVAAEYDAQFTRQRLGGWLRAAVHRHLADLVQTGDTVLELGCGTGEDALWLARQGAHVLATDASAAMLEVARAKAAASGGGDQIKFAHLDLAEIGRADTAGFPLLSPAYDAVLANFGVLNCVPDRRPLAAWLARRVRPGGRLALVVMSPICPWEIGWFLAHGRFGTAVRRLRAGAEANLGDGARVRVWYPSPRRLCAEFAPAFRQLYTAGIGVLLPPSYLSNLVDRWPVPFARLAAWEARLPRRFPFSWLADHSLIVFERSQEH